MAVLKGNVSVFGPKGIIVRLAKGTDRADVEAMVADEVEIGSSWDFGQRVLDNPDLWVDEIAPERHRSNLLQAGTKDSIVKRKGANADPAGVVEATPKGKRASAKAAEG